MMSISIKQEIERNGINRLDELYKEWLNEKQKATDEPIIAYELAEFFEYVDNAMREGW